MNKRLKVNLEMERPKKRALITDLDGTLYNWADFFAPSFRAMIHVLNRITGVDENRLIESFRRVYLEHKTVEYAFAIQELDIWESLKWSPEEIEKKAVKPAWGAFKRVRGKNLRLYPHVREILEWAKSEGLIIIAFTDSPLYQAEMRLKFLRIDRFFDELLSWYGYGVPPHAPKEVLDKHAAGRYVSRISSKSWFAMSEAKPNPEKFLLLLHKHQLSPDNTYMVGDSLWKDVGLAQKIDAHDIWARYGKNVQEKNLETLRRITPWSEEEITKNKEARDRIRPSYTIDDFSEIKSIIGSRYLLLPF